MLSPSNTDTTGPEKSAAGNGMTDTAIARMAVNINLGLRIIASHVLPGFGNQLDLARCPQTKVSPARTVVSNPNSHRITTIMPMVQRKTFLSRL